MPSTAMGRSKNSSKNYDKAPLFIPELSLVAIKDNEIDNEPCLLNGTVKYDDAFGLEEV